MVAAAVAADATAGEFRKSKTEPGAEATRLFYEFLATIRKPRRFRSGFCFGARHNLSLMLSTKPKKRVLDRATARREFMALRPVRNPNLGWEEVEERVVLNVPRPNTWQVKLINVFFPVPEERKVILDPIGSDVWRVCDGQTPISEVTRVLQREYKLGAKEAELSLQQFFKDLGRRGYIGFATPIKQANKQDKASNKT